MFVSPFLVLQLYRLQRIRHASACCIPGTTGTGVDNIFVQPLDGSPGRQVTDLTSENISQFQWSPDGKTLAGARVHDTSDVVMLSEK
jgi:Tol biopolymer transport system component